MRRFALRMAALGCCTLLATPTLKADAGTFPAQNRSAVAQVRDRVEAAHFLSLATFGPTLDEIDALAERIDAIGTTAAQEEWIDAQFALPPTYHRPLAKQMLVEDGFDFLDSSISYNRYKHHAWWQAALTAPDQLRQRMAWALAQIFVVNENGDGFGSQRLDASGEPQYLGIADFYDALVQNAFGTYRQCFDDVTKHPIMGAFLSHARNPKGDLSIGRYPDENYARESMQLFSIGLYQLQTNGVIKRDPSGSQIESYDNDDVKEAARVFTGLSFAGSTKFSNAPRNYHEAMIMHEDWHDVDAKTLLGGFSLPAGQAGMTDIADGLDNLSEHGNTGPFIARLLIQRFVKSNPTKNYIKAVAGAFNNNGSGVRGDFQAVIKALLLNREARDGLVYSTLRKPTALRVSGRGTEHSRLREPVLRYTAFIRALNPTAVLTHTLDGVPTVYEGRYRIPALSSVLNQQAYQAPHVFNFYLPDHRPAGALQAYKPSKRIPNGVLFAPEFEILTPVATNRIADRFNFDIGDAKADYTALNNSTNGRFDLDIHFDLSLEETLANDPEALLTHLDLLLCSGALNDEAKQTIATIVSEETSNVATRARAAILAVVTSPDAAVSY